MEIDIENVDVGHLMRRADATACAITLLHSLQGNALWTDCCSIAEHIEDIARSLGWK